MNKKINLWMLGIAAMLASCSQNEPMETDTSRDTRAVFSVSMDGQINTRAVTDETDGKPSRCLMEVYDANDQVGEQISGILNEANGTFTFTTGRLDKTKEYTFVFWADRGADDYTATDLTAIAPTTAPGIAFSGKVKLTPDGSNTDVTLTHTVAKLVLKQQSESHLNANDKVGISLSVPRYAYNALTEAYTASGSETITLGNDAINIATSQSDILYSTYALVPGGENAEQITVTLNYTKANTGLGTKTLEVPNVPLKRNYRTVLSGDLARLYTGVQQVFSATLDADWDDDLIQTVIPNKVTTGSIEVLVPGTLTTDQITKALTEEANGALALTGTINQEDFILLAAYAETPELTSLDLTGTTGLESVSNPDKINTFTTLQTIKLPESCKTIDINAFRNSGIVTFDGGGVETVSGYSFRDCAALKTINLPCATNIGDYFVYNSNSARSTFTALKLTAPGTIEFTSSTWAQYIITSQTHLYLNQDKQAEGAGTPKVVRSGDYDTWGGTSYGFKTITYENPAPLQ